jgi:hypothetical protein
MDAAWRACGARQGHCGGAGGIEVMSNSRSRRFRVTVTYLLPVTRCQLCHRTVACRPGNLSEVLTGHYRRAHPETLGLRSRWPATETLSAAESYFRAGQVPPPGHVPGHHR